MATLGGHEVAEQASDKNRKVSKLSAGVPTSAPFREEKET